MVPEKLLFSKGCALRHCNLHTPVLDYGGMEILCHIGGFEMQPDKLVDGIVLYTDGSYIPNVGGGAGVHGYTWAYPSEKEKTPSIIHTPIGYKTKETVGNLDPVMPVNYIDSVEPIKLPTTNNRAELMALILGLTYLVETGIKKAYVLLDSQYALLGYMERMEKWAKRGWSGRDGEPIPNVDLWKSLLELKSTLAKVEITVGMEWVEAHAKNRGNEDADKLARKGSIGASNGAKSKGFKSSFTKDYWNFSISHNRLLEKNFLYLSVGTAAVEDNVYFQSSHYPGFTMDLLGKPSPDTGYSVIALKEKDPAIAHLHTLLIDYEKAQWPKVFSVRLDNVFRSSNIGDLMENGLDYFQNTGPNTHLVDIGKQTIAELLMPPKIAYRAADAFSAMKTTLANLLDGTEVRDQFRFRITERIYEDIVEPKKSARTLLSTITNSTETIAVPVEFRGKEVELDLVVGKDLPTRNTLSAIAKEWAEVEVILWVESDYAFRYATLVQTRTGAGLWCAESSNIKLVDYKEDS